MKSQLRKTVCATALMIFGASLVFAMTAGSYTASNSTHNTSIDFSIGLMSEPGHYQRVTITGGQIEGSNTRTCNPAGQSIGPDADALAGMDPFVVTTADGKHYRVTLTGTNSQLTDGDATDDVVGTAVECTYNGTPTGTAFDLMG